MSFTTDDILFAKNNNKIILKQNFTDNILSWKNFLDIFNLANNDNKVLFASFGTCTIDKSETYTNIFDSFIAEFSAVHPGSKISALSIVHFITRNDNNLYDEQGIVFREHFFNTNPQKVPEILPPKEAFSPSIHSDPVDGFFIQFEGSTLWKVYYEEGVEEYILKSGDSMFIPKGLPHSVESLCPRNAVSISFSG